MSIFEFKKKSSFVHSSDSDSGDDDDDDIYSSLVNNNKKKGGKAAGKRKSTGSTSASSAEKRARGGGGYSDCSDSDLGNKKGSNGISKNGKGGGAGSSHVIAVDDEDDDLNEEKILRELMSKKASKPAKVSQSLLNTLNKVQALMSKEVVVADLNTPSSSDNDDDIEAIPLRAAPPADVDDTGTPISLQIRFNGKDSKVIQVLSEMKFSKFKSFLVSHFGLKGTHELKILFDGDPIQDNDTCSGLELEDSDMLDVGLPKERLFAVVDVVNCWNSFKSKKGKPSSSSSSSSSYGAFSSTHAPAAPVVVAIGKSIGIKVRFNGSQVKNIKFPTSSKFAVLCKFLSSHCNCADTAVKIQFDGDNIRSETCESLDMEDGDLIEISIPKEAFVSLMTDFDEKWLKFFKNGCNVVAAPVMPTVITAGSTSLSSTTAKTTTTTTTIAAAAPAAVTTTTTATITTTTATTATAGGRPAALPAKKTTKTDPSMVNITLCNQMNLNGPTTEIVAQFRRKDTIKSVRDWIASNDLVSSDYELLYSYEKKKIKSLPLSSTDIIESYTPNVGSATKGTYQLILMPPRLNISITSSQFTSSPAITLFVRSINTLDRFIDSIANAYNISPNNLRLQLSNGVTITNADRSKTIGDFGIKNDTVLNASSK